MSQAWATVIASLVSAFGGIFVVLINKLRKENRVDHDKVMQSVDNLKESFQKELHEATEDIHEDIKEISKKIDNHIHWHLDK